MPELPDLEAIRGFLNQRLPGVRIEQAQALIPVVFRVPKTELQAILEGNTFDETLRQGKFLLFHLKSGHRAGCQSHAHRPLPVLPPAREAPRQDLHGADAGKRIRPPVRR